ncbi:hypothetical protein [Marinicella sp. W31]|uniref:hypothetical protein n=1 Tax=Marinicella sp. W31 TaxID=3023713 RepID=UPI0037579547
MKTLKNRLQVLIKDEQSDESKSHLLSQELDFEYAKTVLTFALAFIGGMVTLKTALAFEKPIEEGLTLSLGLAGFSAILAFTWQQGIIQDLRLKRVPSYARRMIRMAPCSLMLGVAFGVAFDYFDFKLITFT